MSKYYAVKKDYYSWLPEFFYNEDDAASDGIFIGGNDSYESVNYLPALAIFKAFSNLVDELEYIEDDKNDFINESLKSYSTHDLTDSEIQLISELAIEYAHRPSGLNENISAQLLSILFGETYDYCTICGSVQGEWQGCYYPKDIDRNWLDYVKTVYFGMGDVYEVTEEKLDNPADYEEYDHFPMFVPYTINNAKAELAAQIGCAETEVGIIEQEIYYTYKEV